NSVRTALIRNGGSTRRRARVFDRDRASGYHSARRVPYRAQNGCKRGLTACCAHPECQDGNCSEVIGSNSNHPYAPCAQRKKIDQSRARTGLRRYSNERRTGNFAEEAGRRISVTTAGTRVASPEVTCC